MDHRVPTRPKSPIMRYRGISITSKGIMKDASTSQNRTSRPKNCNRANAYPAAAPNTRVMNVEMTAMYRLFQVHCPMGFSSTLW